MRELNNNLYIYFYTFTHVYEKRRKREENNRSEYILERKKVNLLSTISHKKKEEAKQNISSSYIYTNKNIWIMKQKQKCTEKLRWPFKRINESEILLLTKQKMYD